MMGLVSESDELYHARVEGQTGGWGGAAGDEDGDDFTFGDVGDSTTMESMDVAAIANPYELTNVLCGSRFDEDGPRHFIDTLGSDDKEGDRGHVLAHTGVDAPSSSQSTTGIIPSYFDPTAVHLP
eukprot:CAMPEP_0182597274 /NCGR_PEP_ID=MMETSP1324-20130603/85915_1 /TAXON_ID=236786 /ORGANISM="Florenciella sp., Strain RCC1587" /LENGTH=124 /DNA_ID=CAMNT_0024815011 /DNA_START=45 /DNA_END=416 /DNA_ORIENTATION=-